MSVIDLLQSISALFIRGPSLVWPRTIFNYTRESPHQCRSLYLLSSWFLCDLNILAILPVSLLWMLNSLRSPRVLLGVRLAVGICWLLPIVELIFLSVAVSKESIAMEFDNHTRRCWIESDKNDESSEFVKIYEICNMVIFDALPLLLHIAFWSVTLFRIRKTASFSKNLIKAGFVIGAALATWVPYFVVYAIMNKYPTESYSLVLVAFYISIITNPILITWDKLAFRQGCIQCCHDNCRCNRGREEVGINEPVRHEIQYPTTPSGFEVTSTMDSI